MCEPMQKTGQTATPLEDGIDSPERAVCGKSFAGMRICGDWRSLSYGKYHIFAQKFLPDTPTTATRRLEAGERGEKSVRSE
jgi:hypothetical protein